MPPKVRIQKEDIVKAAVELVRKNGDQALNARIIAAALNCSTQPVFSNFASMEELRMAVVAGAAELFGEYMRRETESGRYVPYKASGMAYIRFAKEEKELFKLLFMRDRTGEAESAELDFFQQMVKLVERNTGLSGADGELFHLEVWAYVHGIAVMQATGYCDLSEELISRMITDAYQGLKKRHEKE